MAINNKSEWWWACYFLISPSSLLEIADYSKVSSFLCEVSRHAPASRYTDRAPPAPSDFLHFLSGLPACPSTNRNGAASLRPRPPPCGEVWVRPAVCVRCKANTCETTAPLPLIHISAMTGPPLSCKTFPERKKNIMSQRDVYDARCYHKRKNEPHQNFLNGMWMNEYIDFLPPSIELFLWSERVESETGSCWKAPTESQPAGLHWC